MLALLITRPVCCPKGLHCKTVRNELY